MPRKHKRRERRKAKHFKTALAAHKAAAGKWGTHVQYVRKTKTGYALYSYPK